MSSPDHVSLRTTGYVKWPKSLVNTCMFHDKPNIHPTSFVIVCESVDRPAEVSVFAMCPNCHMRVLTERKFGRDQTFRMMSKYMIVKGTRVYCVCADDELECGMYCTAQRHRMLHSIVTSREPISTSVRSFTKWIGNGINFHVQRELHTLRVPYKIPPSVPDDDIILEVNKIVNFEAIEQSCPIRACPAQSGGGKECKWYINRGGGVCSCGIQYEMYVPPFVLSRTTLQEIEKYEYFGVVQPAPCGQTEVIRYG